MQTFKPPQIMPDGSLVYEKTTWEPPPEHNGYRRKSTSMRNDDAWTFIPDIVACDKRETKMTVKPSCGCLRIRHFCRHEKSPHRNRQVGKSICNRCPLANVAH